MDPTECGSERLLLTYQQEVMCDFTKVSVTVTKEGEHVDKWIEGQIEHSEFGMDIEWKPNYRKGEDNKVALLQISSQTECLIVQMLHLDYVPSSLRQFLEDPSKTLAGVGITEDARKLARDHGLECKGLVELGKHGGPGMQRGSLTSLKSLAKQILNLDMIKNRKVTMSNWAQPQLDSIQVEYACLDAWVAVFIYSRLGRTTAFNTSPLACGKPSSSGGPIRRREVKVHNKRPYYSRPVVADPGQAIVADRSQALVAGGGRTVRMPEDFDQIVVADIDLDDLE